MTRALFMPEQPGLELHYWNSLASALTYLRLAIEEDKLTEAMSATLCQLTRL